jgi:iron complex outermembrane receptor protein
VKYRLPYLALIMSLPVSAQEADYELVTTAIHTIRSETALPVSIISGDELRESSRATLGDTLGNQPGISNASFGPAVGQTVIRGQQGRRVMNLSNGVPNADASGNSADHAVTVEPILADAIEVLRGPATLLYGGGAIGGVVNVIDNRIPRTLPDDPQFEIESRHDTASDMNTAVSRLEFATGGNLAWHFDGVHRQWNELDVPGLAADPRYLDADDADDNTRGYIPNSGGDTTSVTMGGSWIFDTGFIGLALNKTENTYGLPPGNHGHHHVDEDPIGEEEHVDELVYIDMKSTRADLTGEWLDLAPWIEHIDYRLTWTDYTHAEMEGPGMEGTRYDNDSWQQRLQLTHVETNNWHGVLGMQNTSDTFGARGEESFIPVTDISSLGLFVVEDYHAGNITMELGARFNRDEYDPINSAAPARDYSTGSYSAALLWDMSMTTSVGLTLSHSQRAPSVEELYSNHGLAHEVDCVIHFASGACEIGNSDFNKESSWNLDATFYIEHGAFNATLTAFSNTFYDYIALVDAGSDAGGFPVRQYRQMDARFSGVEVDTAFMLSDYLELQVFGDTIIGRLDGNGDVPRMPPARLGSRLDYHGDKWSAHVSVLHGFEQDRPGYWEMTTNSYTRWDAGVDYTFTLNDDNELQLFARGRNISDDEIRLSTSYLRGYAPEAGRSIEVGLRYTY